MPSVENFFEEENFYYSNQFKEHILIINKEKKNSYNYINSRLRSAYHTKQYLFQLSLGQSRQYPLSLHQTRNRRLSELNAPKHTTIQAHHGKEAFVLSGQFAITPYSKRKGHRQGRPPSNRRQSGRQFWRYRNKQCRRLCFGFFPAFAFRFVAVGKSVIGRFVCRLSGVILLWRYNEGVSRVVVWWSVGRNGGCLIGGVIW